MKSLVFASMKIATTNCGIKYRNRDDLLLITFNRNVAVAGVFTNSSTRAAPVLHCQEAVKSLYSRALIVNSGNANAFTGLVGKAIVKNVVKELSALLNCQEEEVLFCSTGVIGEYFDYKLITNALPNMLTNSLDVDSRSLELASKAIMTTDTKNKISHRSAQINGKEVNITGFAKGSGMIAPNMATMLAFIITDANIAPKLLQKITQTAAEISFNSISVDGDKSTNDSFIAFATADVENQEFDDINQSELQDFISKFNEVAIDLAKMIVFDGEGSKKIIETTVINAENYYQAKNIAMSVINSPLVKTAIAAADPNWGRVIMAIGKAEPNIDPDKIKLWFGDNLIAENGQKSNSYNEQIAHEYLKQAKISITIDIGKSDNLGILTNISARVWGCDLNEEYIKINKDYRS
jgi:glutamate N-acetyltransferase/amino-acid N-acetyltransferase